MDDGAGENDVIAVGNAPVNKHRREAAGRAEVFEILGNVAVAVIHLDPSRDLVADAFAHLLFGHQAMRAEGKDDLHIRVGDAEAVHLIDQHRHEIKAVGDAGRIVADEGDGVAGFHALGERRSADGVANRVQHRPGNIRQGRRFRHSDLAQHTFFVEGKGFRAAAIGE